jgi:hypothetical protein
MREGSGRGESCSKRDQCVKEEDESDAQRLSVAGIELKRFFPEAGRSLSIP